MARLRLKSRHRLMCGDATNTEDVAKLLSGIRPDMVYTDPPYGISIVRVRGGSIGGAKPFGSKGTMGRGVVPPGKYAPVIGDDSTETAVNAFKICSSWNKAILIFWGANNYANALPPSKCWIVWDKQIAGNFSEFEIAWTNLDSRCRMFRHQWSGMIRESERGIKRVHPTQKPVALAEWCLNEFGETNDKILDLFLGSASTLIACEKTNRACFGMELAEAYIDVALKRWLDYTGERSVLESTGEPFNG